MPELDYTNLYNNDVQTKVTVSIIPIVCFVLSTQLIRSLVFNKCFNLTLFLRNEECKLHYMAPSKLDLLDALVTGHYLVGCWMILASGVENRLPQTVMAPTPFWRSKGT